jgi:hypothetical protein
MAQQSATKMTIIVMIMAFLGLLLKSDLVVQRTRLWTSHSGMLTINTSSASEPA